LRLRLGGSIQQAGGESRASDDEHVALRFRNI
jgi:hypothetical protein